MITGCVTGGLGIVVVVAMGVIESAGAGWAAVLVCSVIAALAIFMVARTSTRYLPVPNDVRTGDGIALERQDT